MRSLNALCETLNFICHLSDAQSNFSFMKSMKALRFLGNDFQSPAMQALISKIPFSSSALLHFIPLCACNDDVDDNVGLYRFPILWKHKIHDAIQKPWENLIFFVCVYAGILLLRILGLFQVLLQPWRKVARKRWFPSLTRTIWTTTRFSWEP